MTGPGAREKGRALAVRLRDAGCVFAEAEAELLLDAATSADELERLVTERCAGTPLEVLVGWAEFCGLRVKVRPGVFVPRKRTELVVETALDCLPDEGGVVVDLCTGSGAIALALSERRPDVGVHATDLHPSALRCARDNLGRRAQVHEGDLFAALPVDLRGRVDVITANVPYVPTADLDLLPREARQHEPALSHHGGEDGLDVVRRVVRGAADWLVPGGCAVIEVNRRQAASARFACAASGLPVHTVESEDGVTVVLVGVASPAA